MYLAKQLVIPIALAIFLTFVLSPLVARLQRLGLGRAPAVLVTLGLVGLLSVGVGDLIAHQVAQLASTLPDRREAIKEKIVAAKKWAMGEGQSRFGQLIDDVSGAITSSPNPEGTVVVERATPSMAARFDAYLSPAAEFMGQAALTFILTVFMLLKREDLRNRAIWLFGDGRVTTTTKAVDDASQRVSRYLLSQLLLNTGFGVVIATGMFFLDVKYPILWGFLATLMRYVPYIGTWVGLVPPILFSFATAPPPPPGGGRRPPNHWPCWRSTSDSKPLAAMSSNQSCTDTAWASRRWPS
jgi:predicted PurR-regulated permease PerM